MLDILDSDGLEVKDIPQNFNRDVAIKILIDEG